MLADVALAVSAPSLVLGGQARASVQESFARIVSFGVQLLQRMTISEPPHASTVAAAVRIGTGLPPSASSDAVSRAP
jgi:xanthine/uracil permease